MQLNIKKYLKFLPALLGGILFSGCEQEYRFSTDLGLFQKEVIMPAKEGKNHLLIFSKNDWSIKPLDDDSWFTLKQNRGKGNKSVEVEYTNNEQEHARLCRLLVTADSREDTIYLKQKGLTPILILPDLMVSILSREAKEAIKMDCNIPFENLTMTVIYPEGETDEWLSGFAYDSTNLFFDVKENVTGVKRSAQICFDFVNVINQKAADTVTVFQLTPISDLPDGIRMEFDQLTEKFPPREKRYYIEGVVVSDKNNRNLTYPASEIGRTVYLQNMAGDQAVIVKTKEAVDNCFNFGDHVKIWLKGATIKKDPVSNIMTVTNIGVGNLLYKSEFPVHVTPREKYINELTEKDLYTYVKLKTVEFAVPTGTYFNMNTGYGRPEYIDVYPKMIRDINGDWMYMLTNVDGAKAPYVNGVKYQKSISPRGAGDLTGIIVKENFGHYGTGHTPYYIRHMQESDIALDTARQDGFSTVVAEWSRFRMPEEGKTTLTSETGIGELSHSVCQFKDIRLNDNSLEGVNLTDIGYNVDYNVAKYGGDGMETGGDFRCANWWPDNAKEGAWWLITLPTVGINNPLSLQVEGNSFSSKNPDGYPAGRYCGPCNFVVRYSIDGGNTWKEAGEYNLQGQAIWGDYSEGLVPGFKVVNINLPLECCNQSDLQIRLQMKDRNVGFGVFANNLYNDLGHISIKANK
ncbi:MAG: DUF5689 domain-containing protein [Bacteroidales bacterium]